MNNDVLEFVSLSLLALGALVLAEWATRQRVLGLDTSRRLVHLTVGLFVAIAVVAIRSANWLYVTALLAVVGNLVALNKGWLPSIHGSSSNSIGTVTFPLGLLLLLPFYWMSTPIERYPVALGFAILAVSDPLAAVVGSRLQGRGIWASGPQGKTLAGSTAFGLSATLVSGLWLTLVASVGYLKFDDEWIWLMAALIGTVSAAAEMAGRRGWDNLFIVSSVVLLLESTVSSEQVPFLGWCVLLSIAFGLVSYRLRFLTVDGAVLTGLLGGSVLYFGGWMWLVPPVTFFASSSVLSAWSSRRRQGVLPQQRGERRDAVQVFANGAAGWAIVILHVFFPLADAFHLFSVAFAAAAADTFATEVGTAVRGVTRSIVTGRPVPPGTSGGVSLAGFGAALAGSLLVAVVAQFMCDPWTIGHTLLVTAAGFGAAVVDSFLGATLQARYVNADGVVTDAAETAGRPNRPAGGLPFVTNDTVNFLCTLAGMTLLALGLAILG